MTILLSRGDTGAVIATAVQTGGYRRTSDWGCCRLLRLPHTSTPLGHATIVKHNHGQHVTGRDCREQPRAIRLTEDSMTDGLKVRVATVEDVHGVMDLALLACASNGFLRPDPAQL